jgi:outer membrane receptor protein involved in Fe transport
VLSVGAFYKRFKNAIEETIVPVASEVQRSFQNATNDAVNYGFELEARKSLSVISEDLSNFMLSLNYTWINSEITVQQGSVKDTRSLWGQSPFSINAGLFFVSPSSKTSVNLSYNKSGRRIVQVAQIGAYQFGDPHVYELPRDQIDITVSQPIADSFTLKLALRDILNQPTVWQQGGTNVSSVLRGRSVSLSFGYNIK